METLYILNKETNNDTFADRRYYSGETTKLEILMSLDPGPWKHKHIFFIPFKAPMAALRHRARAKVIMLGKASGRSTMCHVYQAVFDSISSNIYPYCPKIYLKIPTRSSFALTPLMGNRVNHLQQERGHSP